MSYDLLLPHTAQVYRASGSADRFNQPADAMDASTPLHATFSCRLVIKTGGILNDERTVHVFEDRHLLHVEPTADVAEDDVIQVLDAAGGEILPKSRVRLMKKVYAFDELHHLELEMESRRGPRST